MTLILELIMSFALGVLLSQVDVLWMQVLVLILWVMVVIDFIRRLE